MWLAWIGLANVAIFWLEYIYRQGSYGSFWQALPYTVVPIFMGQIGLYYGFRSAPNLLFAGATFTLINVSLRLVNSYRLGEHLNVYNWLGVGLLLIATVLLKIK
jgi:hypothetical protein